MGSSSSQPVAAAPAKTGGAFNIDPVKNPEGLKPCCCCPETKKARDEWYVYICILQTETVKAGEKGKKKKLFFIYLFY